MKQIGRKTAALILALLLSLALLASCGEAPSELPETIEVDEGDSVELRILALKGPTAMGMVEMMAEADSGALKDHIYKFELASAADEVAPRLIQGDVDIAALPANLASVVYNKTEGGVKLLAINTLGVLYIVEQGDSVQAVSDLKGKTIYASGQGATPEYSLKYILSGNGLDPENDVTIEWKSEHAECLSALLQDPEGIALLPQPFVTTAQMKAEGLRVALDLTEEWGLIQAELPAEEMSALITGVCVVRSEFAEEHPEAVSDFMERYRESVAFVNEEIEEAAALIGSYEIVPEAVALKAIPACNIVCTGYPDEVEEAKTLLGGYLKVLYEQNPQAVGGKLPSDDFYYGL